MSHTISRRSLLAAVAAAPLLTIIEPATAVTRVSVRKYGATGRADRIDGPAIQRAINAHVPLTFPPGVYRVAAPLLVDAGTNIQIQAGARLVKVYQDPEGTATQSLFRNRDFTRGIHGFTVLGPGIITGEAQTGGIFGIYGNRINMSGFTVDGWDGGRVFLWAGDDCTASNLRMVNTPQISGNGGIRFVGGARFRAWDCHCESGDDAFQFVPAPPLGASPLAPYGHISDGLYSNCTGGSAARFLIIGLSAVPPLDIGVIPNGWTGSIRNSGFRTCHGYGGKAAAAVRNWSSLGPIADCFIEDCTIDMSRGDAPNPTPDLDIQAYDVTGGISGLRLTRLHVTNPVNRTLSISRAGHQIVVRECRFERGRTEPDLSAVRLGGTDVQMVDCVVDGKGTSGPVVTIDAPSPGSTVVPSGISLTGNRIINIGANYGVGVNSTSGAYIARNVFTESQPGVGKAIRITQGASNVTLDSNDYSGLATSSPVTDLR